MAQLFNIYFPKYKFFTQKDYTITFPKDKRLPFDVQNISGFGLCICNLNADLMESNEYVVWKLYTHLIIYIFVCLYIYRDYYVLNHGLRIESLNGYIFTQNAGVIDFDRQISKNLGNDITITFKETIDSRDFHMKPLGLSTLKSIVLNGKKLKIPDVSDRRIDASSYLSIKHLPHMCRLNNNIGYWSPKEDESLNNCWIRVDLKTTKIIAKIWYQ